MNISILRMNSKCLSLSTDVIMFQMKEEHNCHKFEANLFFFVFAPVDL